MSAKSRNKRQDKFVNDSILNYISLVTLVSNMISESFNANSMIYSKSLKPIKILFGYTDEKL